MLVKNLLFAFTPQLGENRESLAPLWGGWAIPVWGIICQPVAGISTAGVTHQW
jgi:hypothetical protein